MTVARVSIRPAHCPVRRLSHLVTVFVTRALFALPWHLPRRKESRAVSPTAIARCAAARLAKTSMLGGELPAAQVATPRTDVQSRWHEGQSSGASGAA